MKFIRNYDFKEKIKILVDTNFIKAALAIDLDY